MSSRTKNTFLNLVSKLGVSLIVTLLGFFTRKVFVDNIGIEYVGLNGVLKNVLGIMSLLEGGFATSVVYNMYKPLAEDDRPKILALLQLYKKVYRFIALGVAILGIALYPFLGFFLKGGEAITDVGLIYFIFLFNSIINYLSAYKWSLINASQLGYKLTTVNLVYQVSVTVSKLAILYYTKNYILFLLVEAVFNILYNFAVVKKADSLFPFVRTTYQYKVDTDVKKRIIDNVKSLFINRVGGYFMHSTDNLLITYFASIATAGLYSNYTLITGLVKSTIDQVFDSYSESVGNLIASESSDKVYSVFKSCLFISFVLISIPIIVLFNSITPLIDWWLGPKYRMEDLTIALVFVNFYVDRIRSTALTFKTKAGLFSYDRWTPFLQGVINLFLSIILGKKFGINGVLAATAISILSIGFWQFPRLCYKYIFHRSLSDYFKKILLYTFVGFFSLVISKCICSLFGVIDTPFLRLIASVIVTSFVILFVYYLAFHKQEEFKELILYLKNAINLLIETRNCS